MIALIVIAIIAAVIAMLLLIPISCGVYFRWHDSETEFDLQLKYGFIKIKLPHGREKPEDEDKPDAKEPERDPAQEKKKRDTGKLISFAWDNRDRIKRLIAAVLGYILRHAVKIKRLKIKLVMGLDDVMQTALLFGAANAVIFNAAGLMDRHMRLGSHSIDLKPAFNEPHVFNEDEAVISTCIFNVLAIAAVAIWHAVPLLLKLRRVIKNGKSD